MLKLLAPKNVADMLGISPATLNRMIRRAEIPFVLVRPGRNRKIVKFREADVEAWIESRVVAGPERPSRRKNRNAIATENSSMAQVSESAGEIDNGHLRSRLVGGDG